jgi:hypothetical protein
MQDNTKCIYKLDLQSVLIHGGYVWEQVKAPKYK